MKLVRDSDGRRNSLPPMGLTLQKNGISGEETVEERIKTVLTVSGCEFDDIKVLELLDCWGLKHRVSDRVSQLSGGLARRLSVLSGLAPALLSKKSRVVLLDEPSEGLDKSAKLLLINWLKALILRGHGIVIATHDSDLISIANRTLTFTDNKEINLSSQSQPDSDFIIPNSTNNVPIKKVSSLFNWAYRMERRNPIDTINRLIPAILALLLSHALVSQEEISWLKLDLSSNKEDISVTKLVHTQSKSASLLATLERNVLSSTAVYVFPATIPVSPLLAAGHFIVTPFASI